MHMDIGMEAVKQHPEFLLHGLDTVQCAYHLDVSHGLINFEELRAFKESIRHTQFKKERLITLGGREFMLQPNGTRSGYPFVIEDRDFRIQFGEYNRPSFFVTFRSEALWRESSWELNEKFLEWARSIGLVVIDGASLSRADYSFDYYLPKVDFNEDSFVVRSKKDSKHRENGMAQTFTFGLGTDVVVRVYDKVAEIHQQSNKLFFFDLWGRDADVWRIEFQVRKEVLKDYGIRSFEDLNRYSGDLLEYLAGTHATLRAKQDGVNIEDCPLHPLWADLQQRIKELECYKGGRDVGRDRSIEERKKRMAVSMYGYLKRFGAFRSYENGEEFASFDEAAEYLKQELKFVYEPNTWVSDGIHMTNLLRVKGEI